MPLLRIVGYVILFYFISRIVRSFLDPILSKQKTKQQPATKKKEKLGEFIEYEEVSSK